jgi:hypothetical protein
VPFLHDGANNMWWCTSSGGIELNITLNNAKKCFHSGDCELDVIELSKKASIKKQTKLIDKELLIKELSEYGAWNNEELQDHEQNIIRLLWLATADIAENN